MVAKVVHGSGSSLDWLGADVQPVGMTSHGADTAPFHGHIESMGLAQRSITQVGALPIRGPSLLLAAIPSMLGFTPERSAIVLGLQCTDRGVSSVVCTARVDLPEEQLGDDIAAWSDWFADTLEAVIERSHTLLVVVWEDGSTHSVRDMCQLAQSSLMSAGANIADLVLVSDGRWHSLLCESSACCPQEGWGLDGAARDRASELLGLARVAPHMSRRNLEDELDGPGNRGEWPREPPEITPGAFEVAVAHAVSSLTTGSPCDDRDLVLIGIALCDRQVRDTVIWDVLSGGRGSLQHAISVLVEAVRCAPTHYVAPLAACLGLFHWQSGDGIRAGLAIQKSLDADPEYSFSQLLMRCLSQGVSAEEWWAGLRLIGRNRCARRS